MQQYFRFLGISLGICIIASLIFFSIAGPLFAWPAMDEGNYILEAARIAHGALPYRDFYEFITPAGQWLGAAFITLSGLSVLGLRLLCLCSYSVSLLLVHEMTKARLGQISQILLTTFLWLTLSRYPVFQHHLWSGFCSTLAVYYAWRELKQLYAGRQQPVFLVLSGALTGLTFWFTQSLGVLLFLALLAFSVLHVWLQEREAQQTFLMMDHISEQMSGQIADSGRDDRRYINLFQAWFCRWGCFWLLACLGMHALWLGLFWKLDILAAFWRDSGLWLMQGHYKQTTVWGYFVTFQKEYLETIRPFLDGVPFPALLLFIFRLPIVLHLILIGTLPIIALLGAGSALPGRLRYRVLRLEEEERLLFWFASLALVGSTFSYSNSMHIVSNGVIPFMLAWLVLNDWLSVRPRWQKPGAIVLGTLCVSWLLAAIIGSGFQLLGATHLPKFTGMEEPLLFSEKNVSPQQFISVINLLEEAKRSRRPIFIFNESPSLYLPGLYKNATRYTLAIPFYLSSFQLRELVDDLERHTPMLIVDDSTSINLPLDERFATYARDPKLRPLFELPEIQNYIHRHCQLQTQTGIYKIYRCH
jgi:hypothetical protein